MVGEGVVKILQQTLLRNEVMFSLFAGCAPHFTRFVVIVHLAVGWSPSCCGEVVPKLQMYTHVHCALCKVYTWRKVQYVPKYGNMHI